MGDTDPINASVMINLDCNTSTTTELRIDCDLDGLVEASEVYSECKHTCENCS